MNTTTFPGSLRDPGSFRAAAARPFKAAALLLMSCAVVSPTAAQELRAPAVDEVSPVREAAPAVAGRVLDQERPISAAQVYAYDLATYALEKVTTDKKGRFLFDALPAGLYKIVAHKQGFVPAVAMLMRYRSDEVSQDVDLRLVEEKELDVRSAEGYWETRARIPADVLQEIQGLGLRRRAAESGIRLAGAEAFETRVEAQGGVSQLGEGQGEAQLTDAQVDVEGAMGRTQVDFEGRYRELAPSSAEATVASSEARSMALSLERAGQGRLDVAASSSDGAEIRGGEEIGVDLRHYRLSWLGETAGGESELSAQLIDESHYYDSGLSVGPDLPDASRTLNVEGTHSRDLTPNTTLTTGFSYRQRDGYRLLDPDGTLNDELVGAFGVAESQIQPRIMVEYGLYSTMRGGELSLMPHGGMVVSLGSQWQARTSFSQRVEEASNDAAPQSGLDPFTAAFYDDRDTCRQIGESCYEVTFERGDEGAESLSVGAIHREYAETLRLYFSDDFFNRMESIVVVPGDEIPELQFRMVRQVSPRILAKLQSNIASGGGGIFYATDDQAYENQVTYLVTSLDTRFQRTSTGVFLAFHHLEQAFNRLPSREDGVTEPGIPHEIQRLQLMLTQDLSALVGIAPSLALQFNMELSRGATPYTLTDDNELHKKLTGGISVSF